MQDFAGRYGCSHRLPRVRGRDCECGHDRSGQVWFQQFGVRPVPSCVSHFAEQPSGTTDRQDCVTSLPWSAPFSLKLNPAQSFGAWLRPSIRASTWCGFAATGAMISELSHRDQRAINYRATWQRSSLRPCASVGHRDHPRRRSARSRVRPPAASGVRRQASPGR
jgi:hypothetical protein